LILLFFQIQWLSTADDIARTCGIAVLYNLEFHTACVANQYLIYLDRFHNLLPPVEY
jgi:hypothetical protein